MQNLNIGHGTNLGHTVHLFSEIEFVMLQN